MIKQKNLEIIKKKSIKELVSLRNILKKKIFDLKIQNSLKNLKNISEIKRARREIAQVETILHTKINKTNEQ